MIDAPLALGFAAGMLAAFNPCGFALFPTYVAFFLGVDGEVAGPGAPVVRALVVGSAVTAGFVAVFGLAGIAITTFSLAVQRAAPWVAVPVGLALMALGVGVAAGWKPVARLPSMAAGGSRRAYASMAAYGASYATVSLSCTLPVFLAAVATTFEDASLLSGSAVFVAYALGMGTVLTGLALGISLARRPLGTAFRRASSLISRLGGVLLAVAGAYVTWYAIYEIRLSRGDDAAPGPVDAVTRWSGQVSELLDTVGTGTIGAVVAALLLAGAAEGWRRRRGPSGSERIPSHGNGRRSGA